MSLRDTIRAAVTRAVSSSPSVAGTTPDARSQSFGERFKDIIGRALTEQIRGNPGGAQGYGNVQPGESMPGAMEAATAKQAAAAAAAAKKTDDLRESTQNVFLTAAKVSQFGRIWELAGGLIVKACTLSVGAITGLVAIGLRGTTEAKMFGDTLTQLGRAVGGIFAPQIRIATQMLANLTGWVRNLSTEGRAALVVITATIAVTGALAAGMLGLSGAVIAAAGAFLVLDAAAGPWLVAAAIAMAAIGVVLVGVPALVIGIDVATRGWHETLVHVLAKLKDIWDTGVRGFAAIGAAIQGMNSQLGGTAALLGLIAPALASMLGSASAGSTQWARDQLNRFGLTPGGNSQFEGVADTFKRVQSQAGNFALSPEAKLLTEIRDILKTDRPDFLAGLIGGAGVGGVGAQRVLNWLGF